jgi:hypothetical protein
MGACAGGDARSDRGIVTSLKPINRPALEWQFRQIRGEQGMITNLKRNCMGTVSFDGKFAGMRKAQDFIVYPMHETQAMVKVQSDTRIGMIDMTTGQVLMSPARPGGAYNAHLAFAVPVDNLSGEELLLLKTHIAASAHGMAGTNGIVYTDNSGAMEVFGSVQS